MAAPSRLEADCARVGRVLASQGVSFAVVGGLAVNLPGRDERSRSNDADDIRRLLDVLEPDDRALRCGPRR